MVINNVVAEHYCMPYFQSVFYISTKVGLGPERAQSMCPLAWLVEEGVPFALHSDFTMAPAQPLLLAWAAVNRKTVNGNISRPGNI